MSTNPNKPLMSKNENWKSRYCALYSIKKPPCYEQEIDDGLRISFMEKDRNQNAKQLLRTILTDPYAAAGPSTAPSTDPSASLVLASNSNFKSLLSRPESRHQCSHDTTLLDLVRTRNCSLQNEQHGNLDVPNDDVTEDDKFSEEACIHGMGWRMATERSLRSVSRSRVSRTSTKRDMDIPSILAYKTTPPQAPLEIPAFTRVVAAPKPEPRRWSIRRATCPVCSQKWKDKSSISNVKYSGLRKNSSTDLMPSIKLPGRLRASITSGYNPRPAQAAVDLDAGVVRGRFRNSGASSWQLKRARRYRLPKSYIPESIEPTAQMALDLLDRRVHKFLSTKQNDILDMNKADV